MSGTSKSKGKGRSLADAQQDEGFIAWMDMMEYQVEMFLTMELDGLPDDPFTREGLAVAEAALLSAFPDTDALRQPESFDLWDGYARFLGETLVRRFGGKWVNVPDVEGDGSTPGVLKPHNPNFIEVFNTVYATVHRRTGREWSKLYDYAVMDAEDAARATKA